MPRPDDKIGPYTLISKLGRGAFGVVWLAEKRTAITTTKVAIKIPNDEDVDLEAVRQEASLWVHASGHPNVLPIIDADIHDEQVIIVSEYAPDGSLSKWLVQHGGKAPSLESAVEMTLGILAGLEHLHERGIIHRDLKPDNILLQRGNPRLADFGISRILKSTSKSTVATGTPAYMPPEAFDGKRSEQTDIWSAGVIFYQLLSGQLPFPQAEFTALVGAIITREPEPLPLSIPEPIRKVVERALRKNQAERFTSASEMRQALRDAVQQQPPISNRDIKTEVLPINATGLPPTILDSLETPQGKSVREQELSETQKFNLEYWTEFGKILKESNSLLVQEKPSLLSAQNLFPFGRKNFRLAAFVKAKGQTIGVTLILYSDEAKQHFHLLSQNRAEIEEEIGDALDWRERPDAKESYITLSQDDIGFHHRQDWRRRQHLWLLEKLELFDRVFAPRIKNLNASDDVRDNQSAELPNSAQRAQTNEAASSPTAVMPPPPEQTLQAPAPTVLAPTQFSHPSPPQQFPYTPVPVATPAQNRRWLWAIGGFVALLLVGIIIYAAVRGLKSNKSTTSQNKTNSNSRPVVTPAPEKWTQKQAFEATTGVSTLGFSPDGRYLAFDGGDLALLNVQTGSVERRIKYPNITHLSFSPDSKTVVTSSTDPHIKIWDVETGSLKQEIKEGSTTIYRAVFSPDGKLVAFNDGNYHIVWWNVQTGALRRSQGESDAYYLNDLAFSPDGKILASCATFGATVKLWEVQTLALIRELKGHDEEIEAVAFSPDGKTLASGGWDKTIKLWDVATGKLKQTLNNGERVGSLAFHPDGKIIAVGGFDQFAVNIWDVQTGTLKQTLEGHTSLVWAMAFSPDGTLLASGASGVGGSHKTLILWQGLQP